MAIVLHFIKDASSGWVIFFCINELFLMATVLHLMATVCINDLFLMAIVLHFIKDASLMKCNTIAIIKDASSGWVIFFCINELFLMTTVLHLMATVLHINDLFLMATVLLFIQDASSAVNLDY